MFVVEGELDLTLAGRTHEMSPGGYAYLPPGSDWQVRNHGETPVRFPLDLSVVDCYADAA